ncbi:MAG TPA: protein-L-isoaspartate O-methyltransferase [Dehalococcoidia bacterium]|nr:protein-L-isoaspartate O-methyltransferase [Dehalococcoidia bacterium]
MSALDSQNQIKSPAVRQAFRAVPRHLFIAGGVAYMDSDSEAGPGEWVLRKVNQEEIYSDEPLVVKLRDGVSAVSCSAPSVVAQMLDNLDLEPGQKVLEVGTGTGWTAALIAHIVGGTGSMCSVEIDGEYAAQAKETLQSLSLPRGMGNVKVIHGDGSYGYGADAPYDRAIVHSSAPWIPRAWQDQLKAGGLLLAIRESPTSQQMLALRKVEGAGGESELIGAAVGPAFFALLQGGTGIATVSPGLGRDTPFGINLTNVEFPDPIPLPAKEEDRETFHLLQNQDFLFYLDLHPLPLQQLLYWLNPDVPEFSNPRPVVVDALSNEVLFGPEYDSTEETGIYGSAAILHRLNQAKLEWRQLGSPRLVDYRFRAVPPGSVGTSDGTWQIPAPSEEYLDWVIEVCHNR